MVRWDWGNKLGEIEYDGRVLDIYSGNCLMIALYRDEMNDEGLWTYHMPPLFFDDDTHAKRCLGLSKGFDDIFEGLDIRITLYRCKWDKTDLKKIISLFSARKGNTTIIILEEVPA